MFILRALLWTLCVGLSVHQDSLRDHKLNKLLQSLQTHRKPIFKPSLNSMSPNSSSLSPEELDSIQSYQDFYRTLYGTPEGVNYLRKHYGPNGLQQARAKFGVNKGMEEVRQANNHLLRMRSRGRCRVPVAQVVRVKDFYPDPSREYRPRCTLLHRCGAGAGCCIGDAFRCVPSQVQEVAMHFYTLTVDKRGLSEEASIEKLLFENHTACECRPINDMPRMMHNPLVGKQKCSECPVPFSRREFQDGRCGCDCFDRQRPCIRIKRGREPLSQIEKKCVEARHCHIPECEFGRFNSRTGYCPRKHEEKSHPWTTHRD